MHGQAPQASGLEPAQAADASLQGPGDDVELTPQEMLAFAMQLHRENRLDAAQECYRGLLLADPGNLNAKHYLGVLLYQSGKSAEALELMTESLAGDASVASWHNNLGNVLLDAGRFDEAAEAYARCSALDPDNREVLNNLGVLLRQQHRPQEAEAVLKRALALDSGFADAHSNLATLYTLQGRMAEAFSHFADAVALAPRNPNTRRLLIMAYGRAGRFEDGLKVCREWLVQDPGSAQALHFLAAYGGAAVPERASDAYVEKEFDGFAKSFDAKLAALDYRAPQLVGEAVARLAAGRQPGWRVVDAGCGTGLCGPYLRPLARVLVGVDLSANMMERARLRGLYDTLVKSELVAFLDGCEEPCDLVVSADTLCYFGRLDQAFSAVRKALRVGGYWVFTVEVLHEGEGFKLESHGRYSHARAYLESALARARFDQVDLQEVVLRHEGGVPVAGWLVCACAREST